MKSRILTGILSLLVLACNTDIKTESSLLDYLPKNTTALLKINAFNSVQSEIKNNAFLTSFKATKVYNEIKIKTSILKHISAASKSILAFSKTDSTALDLFFITKDSLKYNNRLDSITTNKKQVPYKNTSFNEFTVDNSTYYCATIDHNFIISTSRILIEEVLSGEMKSEDRVLKKLYKTANTSKSATIFINTTKNNLFSNNYFTTDSIKTNFISDWVSLDVNTKQSQLNLTGINLVNDSLPSVINLFKNTVAITNTIQEYTPENAEAILSYTFNDYSIFAKNRKNLLKTNHILDTIFNTVEEIGIIYLDSKKAVMLQTYGSDNIYEYLNEHTKSETNFNGNQITTLVNNTILTEKFSPIITDFESKHYTIIGNAFLFSEDIETLQKIISNYKNNTTFNKTAIYASAKETIANESSVLYINSKKLKDDLTTGFTENFTSDFKSVSVSDYFFVGQIVADNNFYHTSLTIQKTKKENKNNTTSSIFTVQLDNDLATNPQFVTNHRTHKKEIVVQDTENQLYLISTTGKVIWKKQLEGRIQGDIAQVDIYKNGKLQLAFTTNNQFLILDRNGEKVEPFTIKFDGGNLNPLAVFDYENNKDYRFVITQGQKIYMYNNKAKIVKGFTYTTANSPVAQKPKHFRTNNKDYITFVLENGDLKILNRIGKERVKTTKKIDFSDNEVELYKNKFSITDKEGTLHQIALNAKTTQTKLKANKDHGFDATSNTLVLMNENSLTIKGQKVTLELGVYTKPQIFYINDKIYVSVTDIQNQKIYLFDSNAKSIQNFPVYGSSIINLADMDNDKKLELVSKDLDNSIVVYRLN